MKKEEYVYAVESMRSDIEVLNDKIKQCHVEYINANKKHELGEKLRVTTKRGEVSFGFVYSISIDWQDNIRYDLKAMKKDGTISKNNLYVGFNSIVDKCL